MTKKDYELIAKAIRPTHNGYFELDANACQLVYVLADALQSDNPRFDRTKFLEACGVTA